MSLLDYPPILVLLAVFFLIMVRQVGRVRLQIWQVMLAGAVAVLLLGDITPAQAIGAINVHVILFLFGMFVVGEALHQSGYLYLLSYRMFNRARTLDRLVLFILFGLGGLSALLMNDTVAIICTPLMIYFAREHKAPVKMLLLALAFAITTGSVMSPIGNPQNLLIALDGGIDEPFTVFVAYLAIPTCLNLLVAYGALRLYYRREFHSLELEHSEEELIDPALARLSRLSLWLVGVLIAARIGASLVRMVPDFSLTWIALVAAAPILLFSKRRFTVLRYIDWATLVFFAAMFVLMEAIWRTGVVQKLLSDTGWDITKVPVIIGISVLVSQFVSNVPFVALYLPGLVHVTGAPVSIVALAAGSTIAGNLLILGAASNIIIIQNAEKRGETITFWEFARIGLPLTFVQAALYWLYLSLW